MNYRKLAGECRSIHQMANRLGVASSTLVYRLRRDRIYEEVKHILSGNRIKTRIQKFINKQQKLTRSNYGTSSKFLRV